MIKIVFKLQYLPNVEMLKVIQVDIELDFNLKITNAQSLSTYERKSSIPITDEHHILFPKYKIYFKKYN